MHQMACHLDSLEQLMDILVQPVQSGQIHTKLAMLIVFVGLLVFPLHPMKVVPLLVKVSFKLVSRKWVSSCSNSYPFG